MQPRAAQTRCALIRAAAQVFDQHGAKGAGLVEISRAAGVSRGALHHHFASKNELIHAICADARTELNVLVEELLAQQLPPQEKGARFLTILFPRLGRDPVVRAGMRLAAEGYDSPPGGESLLEECMKALHGPPPTGREASDRGDGMSHAASLTLVVAAGLEALGRTDASWWAPETVADVARLLLLLTESSLRPTDTHSAATAATRHAS